MTCTCGLKSHLTLSMCGVAESRSHAFPFATFLRYTTASWTALSGPTRIWSTSRTRQGLELLFRRVTHQARPIPDLRDERVAGALGPPDHHVVAAVADHLEPGLVVQPELTVGLLRDDEE